MYNLAHCESFVLKGVVKYAMRFPFYRQCWTTVFLVFSLIVVVLIFLVNSPGVASIPMFRRPFVSVACYANMTDTGHGAHNFRRPNRVISEYDDNVARRLASLVERRATAADPDLIRLIVDMMDPPSKHMVKMSRQLFSTPQSREVDKILNRKVRPIFISPIMVVQKSTKRNKIKYLTNLTRNNRNNNQYPL